MNASSPRQPMRVRTSVLPTDGIDNDVGHQYSCTRKYIGFLICYLCILVWMYLLLHFYVCCSRCRQLKMLKINPTRFFATVHRVHAYQPTNQLLKSNNVLRNKVRPGITVTAKFLNGLFTKEMKNKTCFWCKVTLTFLYHNSTNLTATILNQQQQWRYSPMLLHEFAIPNTENRNWYVSCFKLGAKSL